MEPNEIMLFSMPKVVAHSNSQNMIYINLK